MNGMGMMGLGIVLTLNDLASSGLDKVRQKLQGFTGATKDAMKAFDEGTKQILGGFTSIVAGVQTFRIFDNVFGNAVNIAANFEQAMARVKAVSNATGAEFEALTKQAQKMGRETQFTAMDAAGAQENLIRAGLNIQKTMSALPSVLNMAAAEGLSLAESADIMATTMNQFKLGADDATRIANVFADASRSTSLSIRTLSEAMKYAAPTAKSMGMSLEETTAWLGVLSNAGLRGSIGGTGFSGVLAKLIDENALGKIKDLGVKVTDEFGKALPADKLIASLKEQLKGMDDSALTATLFKIFGKIGFKAASGMLGGIVDSETGEYFTLLERYQNVGNAAKEMADIMNDTLHGARLRLQSATEGLNNAIGETLEGVYTRVINAVANIKNWITDLLVEHPLITKAVINLAAGLTALIGTLLIVGGALTTLGGLIKVFPMLKDTVTVWLANMKTNALTATGVLKGMLAPMLAMIAIAGAIYLAWRKNFLGIRDMFTVISEGFQLMLGANADGIAEIDDELAKKLEANGLLEPVIKMGQIFWRIKQFIEGFFEGFVEAWKSAAKMLRDMFSPAIEAGGVFVDMLTWVNKLLSGSQAKSWKNFGVAVGYIAAAFSGLFAITKTWKTLKNTFDILNGGFNMIKKHPVAAALTAIAIAAMLLYEHWDDLKKLWNDSPNLQRYVTLFGSLAGVILTVIGAFKTAAIVKGIIESITGAMSLLNLAFLTNPIVLAITGIIVAALLLWYYWDDITKWIQEAWDSIDLKNIFEPVVGWIKDLADMFENLVPDWMKNSMTDKERFIRDQVAMTWTPGLDEEQIRKQAGAEWDRTHATPEKIMENAQSQTTKPEPPKIPEQQKAAPVKVSESPKPDLTVKANELGLNLPEIDVSTLADYVPQTQNAAIQANLDNIKNLAQTKIQQANPPAVQTPVPAPVLVNVTATESVKEIVTNSEKQVENTTPVPVTNTQTEIRETIEKPVSSNNVSDYVDRITQAYARQYLQKPEPIAQKQEVVTATSKMPDYADKITQSFADAYAKKYAPKFESANLTSSYDNLAAKISEKFNSPINPEADAAEKIAQTMEAVINELQLQRQPASLNSLPEQQNPSSQVLNLRDENQAWRTGRSTYEAIWQNPEKMVNVNNQFDVSVEGRPADVYLDGNRVGQVAYQWVARHELRQGNESY